MTATYHGDYGIDKIGKPVDPNVWELYPQEVNAGEDPVKNVLFFPAGILQPPFFSKDADDAINYGGIGAVIGHEMTHGFDDQGRKYDENGNLTDWWTEADAQKFNESTRALVDEYNKLSLCPVYSSRKLHPWRELSRFRWTECSLSRL